MFALDAKDDVYAALRELGLSFEVDEHEPVFTIEEMEALGLNEKGMVVKNLFLRDQKGKKHFLVLLPSDRHADLKSIGEQLGAGKQRKRESDAVQISSQGDGLQQIETEGTTAD